MATALVNPANVELFMTLDEARYLLQWIDERAPFGALDGPVQTALRAALQEHDA